MRLLIVNADDLGLSVGVNEGIVAAHAGGIVTSTSLMVVAPAAEHAATAARDHRALSVGLHFVDDSLALDDPAHAARLFAQQLERFRELVGSDPTHVDSHHHVHIPRMATFAELVSPLGVPLRGDGRVPFVGEFWGQPEARGVTDLRHVGRDHLVELVGRRTAEGFTELICHPATVTGDFESSYVEERAAELATLTAPGLREQIEALGVKLASYHDWHRHEIA